MSKNRPKKREMLADLKNVQLTLHGEDSGKVITRAQYRKYGQYSERCFREVFGNFQEFRRQAGVTENRDLGAVSRHVAKHASVDQYRTINKERKDWGEMYVRDNSSRYQLLIGAADFHDSAIDPFLLRVFLDTVHRSQPDKIVFAGDVFDLPEFSKFHQDPREWDVVAHLKFAHDKIFGPVRERAPDAQIDLIEGNHERRLLKHITANSPVTKVILSDWCGLTIKDVLRLHEHQMNYIAEADLTAWTKRDEEKELAKNFRIYYDCLMAHHYSNVGRSYGYPGFSGHNHRHELWIGHSPIFGPYEWHQIGCGHRRDANYTDGLHWHNGFILCHVDTKDKLVNFEYVPVTNHAVVGGKMYTRKKSEIVLPGLK